MNKRYLLKKKHKEPIGPFDFEVLSQKIREGHVDTSDEISEYPDQKFFLISKHPELLAVFTEKPKSTDQTVIVDLKNAFTAQDEATRIFKDPESVVKNADLPPTVPNLANAKEKTRLIDIPKELIRKSTLKKSMLPQKSFLVIMLLALVVYEMEYSDDDEDDVRKGPDLTALRPIRPELPRGGTEQVSPDKSQRVYDTVMKTYLQDTVQGYRKAIDGFHLALRYDPQNTKALAMLASSYLNLMDSINKDEKSFTVISKLIDLSRAKNVDLVETLIAEVEFLVSAKRYDPALQKLIDYAKVNTRFDPALYLYTAWMYWLKGDLQNASRILDQIPSQSLPFSKLYYLRGVIAEGLHDYAAAKKEYVQALKINPKHSRSMLGFVRMTEQEGDLRRSERVIDFLYQNPSLQSPKEYVEALVFRSKLALLYKKPGIAVESFQVAMSLDPTNDDLKFNFYSLMSQLDKSKNFEKLAKMYGLVLSAENKIRKGLYHEASTLLIEAKDSYPKSFVPLEKMGDLYMTTEEYQKAVNNYKKALELDKKSPELAVKLINALIKSHELEDAKKYLAIYRTDPKINSAIDRLVGDIAFQLKAYTQAIEYYRKAMSRDVIDPQVYLNYAEALRETEQCKDAQFFYALSQRYNPMSAEAVLGAAQCVLVLDGVESAVSRIKYEIEKNPKSKAAFLSGIAEIYSKNGNTENAFEAIKKVKEVDSGFADIYRIEGDLYLRQNVDRTQNERKALDAYLSYSDRRPGDPYGYLQRFNIFLRDSNFQRAAEELDRVFNVSPRYPELHLRRGSMYSRMGKNKDAIIEFEEELKLNPKSTKTLIALGNELIHEQQIDAALKVFNDAIQMDPNDPASKIGAGYANYLKRQYSVAVALFKTAISMDKGNPDVYKKLGWTYRDMGDMVNAAQAFRSYLDLSPDAPDRGDYEKYR